MATLAATTTPQQLTAVSGSQVTFSAACTLGITSAGAASGPSVNGTITWPTVPETITAAGAPSPEGYTTLWVQAATTANVTYLS